MNNPRIIGLFAQILQTCCAIGIDIVRVVKSVKEIRRKSEIRLPDFEVLEHGDVRIPCPWADQTGPLTWIEEIRTACAETTAVCQSHGQPASIKAAAAVWSEGMNRSLTAIRGNQSRKVSSRHVGCLGRIEISLKPQTLVPAENIHLDSLVGAEDRITSLEAASTNAPPEAAPPISNGGDLPAADHLIESSRSIACEFLSPAEGKINDAVETNVVGRDLGGVEIDEVKPLAVSELGLAKKVNDFGRRSSGADIVYAGVAAGKPSRVGRG